MRLLFLVSVEAVLFYILAFSNISFAELASTDRFVEDDYDDDEQEPSLQSNNFQSAKKQEIVIEVTNLETQKFSSEDEDEEFIPSMGENTGDYDTEKSKARQKTAKRGHQTSNTNNNGTRRNPRNSTRTASRNTNGGVDKEELSNLHIKKTSGSKPSPKKEASNGPTEEDTKNAKDRAEEIKLQNERSDNRKREKERQKSGTQVAKATLRAATDERCDWRVRPLSFLKGEVCGSYYKVLGIDRTEPFDKASLKKAFRQVSLSVHPDKNPANEADSAFK